MISKVEQHSEEAEKAVRDIPCATRRQYSAEEKVRIVIAGLRGEAASLSCAARRASTRISIIAGRRTSRSLASACPYWWRESIAINSPASSRMMRFHLRLPSSVSPASQTFDRSLALSASAASKSLTRGHRRGTLRSDPSPSGLNFV